MKPSSSATHPRRARGRPAGDDDALRERIVDCALRGFVRDGIAGTTLAAVARDSGVAPALVNYYFGNKDGLIDALVATRLQPAMQRVVGLLQAPAPVDPLPRLRAFAFEYVRSIAAEPWIARLIVREVLSEGGALRARFAEQFAAGVIGSLQQAMADAQRAGRLRGDLPAAQLVLNLLALLVYPFLAAPVLGPALGLGIGSEPDAWAERQWQQFLGGAEARK